MGSILVIEDERDLLHTVRAVLEEEGFQVVIAEDGEAGLRALEQMDTPMLILLDLLMPRLDGWEFLSELRAAPLWSDVPVVVTTAAQILSIEGADHVLRKPFGLTELLQTLERFGRRPPSDKAAASAITPA